MQKAVDGSTIAIPVTDHFELAVGTLRSIIRQYALQGRLFIAP